MSRMLEIKVLLLYILNEYLMSRGHKQVQIIIHKQSHCHKLDYVNIEVKHYIIWNKRLYKILTLGNL